MQRVFAVRVGDKYGPHYEDYINSKIPNVTWIKEEVVGPRQWNKLYPMSLDIDEPVVVIDIDMMFINNYMDAINYPIKRGEFLAAKSWWRDTPNKNYSIQGGFQKYYPKQKITIPGMGEQYFVEDMARQNLVIKHLPDSWITRWQNQMTQKLVVDLNHHYPDDWLHLGQKFYQQVRLVHFLDQESLDKEKLEALANSEPFLT